MPGKQPRTLIPFNHAEAITAAEGARLAGRDPRTIKAWAEVYAIGRKIAGRWLLSHPALLMFLDADKDALTRYLSGDRESERVQTYFRRAGVRVPASVDGRRG